MPVTQVSAVTPSTRNPGTPRTRRTLEIYKSIQLYKSIQIHKSIQLNESTQIHKSIPIHEMQSRSHRGGAAGQTLIRRRSRSREPGHT